MEHIHFLEIVSQVFAFIGTQDTKRKIEQCPEMNRIPGVLVDFSHIMNLGMAIMAGGDAIVCLGSQDLVGLGLAIGPALLLEAGLKEPAAAAAAEVVGSIGSHVNEIFFTDHGSDNVPQIFCNRIAERLSDQLTGILDREFDLPFFVPV